MAKAVAAVRLKAPYPSKGTKRCLGGRGLLGRAGPPRIRFHDLRHSCATLLLSEGLHPKIVSDLLGHSQIGITLDLYSHVTATMQAVAAEAMGGC